MRTLSAVYDPSLAPSRRTGASLTEVLIAILILSIGVSAIFSLFPLSILSSIKATQLTNSKLMTENVKQYVRVNPYDLTRDRPLPGALVRGDAWQPNRGYSSGEVVVPSYKRGSMLPEPFRLYRAIVLEWNPGDFPASIVPSAAGVSGITEPSWTLTNFNGFQLAVDRVQRVAPNLSRMIAWEPVDTASLANSLDATILPYNSWVVDPSGSVTFSIDGTLGGAANEFGCRADQTGVSGLSVTSAGWTRGLPRTSAGIDPVAASLRVARGISSHRDAWSEVVKFQPLGLSSATVIQLGPTDLGATAGLSLNPQLNRLIVHSLDGTRSVVRNSPNFNQTTREISFPEPLPAYFAAPNVLGEVTVEAFEDRYTWITTVNNSVPGNPQIKCAVLFKRKFLPGEEHVYFSVFGNDPTPGLYVPPTGSDLETGWNAHVGAGNVIQDDQIFVVWNSASEPRPLMQEGKYVLRPNPTGTGVEWYKIVSVDIREPVGSTVSSAIITVDRSVNGPTGDAGVVDRSMFLRGLVEVFDL